VSDKTQVNLVVNTEQKHRWEEYADEVERSLSGLIRLAVEKEIRSDGDEGSQSDDAEALPELEAQLNRIQTQLGDLDSKVGVIEREVRQNPEIAELANDVFQLLPVGQEEIISAEHSSGPREPVEYGEVDTVSSGRVDDLAETLDVEAYQIRDALDHLQENTHQVHTTDVSGETRYYKEE